MSQFLVLRLADPVSWIIIDADGGRIGPVSTGNLADAAPLAGERPLVVIAPGASVTFAQPELPVKGGARLAQIVPYAMEELLAGEVEQFHFAVGRTDAEGRTLVAAVRRDELRGWLDALKSAGLDPQSLVPEPLCVPDNPGKIVAVIDAGQLHVRAPGALPVALDAEPLTEAFALAGLEGEDRHVQLYVSQQDWQHSREMIEALREVTGSLDLQLLPDGALPLLAAGSVRSDALSLLQGEFARRTGWRAEWQRWRIAAFLALAALALHIGVRGYDLIRLRAEEQRLDASIEQAVRIALPDVERIVDARAQIEQRLAGGGAADPQGLLARLAAVGGAMSGATGPTIESLGWRNGSLQLQMIAADTEVFARFAQALTARGLTADVESTTPGDKGVSAQINVTTGPAT
ncbi:MAG: Type secretion system protein [Steroidobacteraceae bacterium]|nr:Type secretion system protein [Steroidobacteraceae bacterium]MBM2853735.1 Type secretion system protein [Steroidobacteraceae bacterium]